MSRAALAGAFPKIFEFDRPSRIAMATWVSIDRLDQIDDQAAGEWFVHHSANKILRTQAGMTAITGVN
jgi:hypothetical protein